MEPSLVGPTCLNIHPIYGAIYHDGEFVQRGAVLGLSVDCKDVVVAPVSGWVRLGSRLEMPSNNGATHGLCVEIWQSLSDAEVFSTPLESVN
ncbi:MAG TPA: hypothetical protein VKU00_18210 [Chthonomonadaceae bacterium]|nr:hypothetical protein [Chthonomonadaceae bacterium]